MFTANSLQVPLAGKCGLGISFHTGELSSASPCCFPCAPLLGCRCPCSPNSCCPPDNKLVVFTPVREVISEMDSSVKDCWVAVGTFTGLGVGLMWGGCSCSEKDACSCIQLYLSLVVHCFVPSLVPKPLPDFILQPWMRLFCPNNKQLHVHVS